MTYEMEFFCRYARLIPQAGLEPELPYTSLNFPVLNHFVSLLKYAVFGSPVSEYLNHDSQL